MGQQDHQKRDGSELLIVFIYNLRSQHREEEEDSKSIVYWHPPEINEEKRVAIVGQLMGVVQFYNQNFGGVSLLTLMNGKFCVGEIPGDSGYLLSLGSSHTIPDYLLREKTDFLIGLTQFYYGGSNLEEVFKSPGFNSLVNHFTVEIDNLPLLRQFPKSAHAIELESNLLLQSLIRTGESILGGVLFYEGEIVADELGQCKSLLKKLANSLRSGGKISGKSHGHGKLMGQQVVQQVHLIEEEYESLCKNSSKYRIEYNSAILMVENATTILREEDDQVEITKPENSLKETSGISINYRKSLENLTSLLGLSHYKPRERRKTLHDPCYPFVIQSGICLSACLVEEIYREDVEMEMEVEELKSNEVVDDSDEPPQTIPLEVTTSAKEVTPRPSNLPLPNSTKSHLGSALRKRKEYWRSMKDGDLNGNPAHKQKQTFAPKSTTTSRFLSTFRKLSHDEFGGDSSSGGDRLELSDEIESSSSTSCSSKDSNQETRKYESGYQQSSQSTLKQLSLYTNRVGGLSLLLLMDAGDKKLVLDELIRSLGAETLTPLLQLSENLESCRELLLMEDQQANKTHIYDSLNSSWSSSTPGSNLLHHNFKSYPPFTEVVVRTPITTTYGYKLGNREVYYEQPTPQNNITLPLPTDSIGKLNSRVKSRLEKEHSLLLL